MDRRLLATWAALLVLLALTVASAYLSLGKLNTLFNLAIACAKASLVLIIFMELANSKMIIKAIAATAIAWLLLLLCLGLEDFVF